MPIADSNRGQLYYGPEATWGTTPAAALKEFRFTSESLKQSTQSTMSEEIRSDRQVTDVVRTGIQAEGDVGFEVSFGALDDFIAGALMSNWAADGGTVDANDETITNGTTAKSFTLEKKFSDVGEYEAYTGMRVNTLAFTLETGSLATGTAGFIGKKATPASATVGTGAPTAAPTAAVMNTIDHITGLKEGGATIADILSVTLNINNNLRAQPALGVLGATGVGLGRFELTGSLRAYFTSRALYEKYINWAASSLEFSLSEGGNLYTFMIPALRYTDGAVPIAGGSQDVVVDLPFTAYRDSASGNTIKIVKNPTG